MIGGLTYNFLPFMVLPIYVALERIDPALVEAAPDLYAVRGRGLREGGPPAVAPGVFAGIVLLTFVPAAADYVNAAILGGRTTTMIGNVIQTQYVTNPNYPMAAALSFILMAGLLIAMAIYARVFGSRTMQEHVA